MAKISLKSAKKIVHLFEISDNDLNMYSEITSSKIKNVAQFLVNNLHDDEQKQLFDIIRKMK